MNKKLVFFYKTLVVGVIFLFLGVGIQPSVAVKSEKEINIVKAPPIIEFFYEYHGDNCVEIFVMAWDETSSMDRLEIYFNDRLKDTFYGGFIQESILIFEYPPVPFLIIKAVAYDNAGNRAVEFLNLREVFGLDIYSGNDLYHNYSQYDFFKVIIDRFLLLEIFLRIIEIL